MNKKKLTTEEIFKSAFDNHKKNNLQEPEDLYKKAIQQKPDHVNSLFYLGGLLAQKKNFEVATGLFEKVIKINPKYPSIKFNLLSMYKVVGNIFSKKNNLSEAKNIFEKALILDPDNSEVAHLYGTLLLKINQHIKGLNYIRKGTSFIRFTPKNYKII